MFSREAERSIIGNHSSADTQIAVAWLSQLPTPCISIYRVGTLRSTPGGGKTAQMGIDTVSAAQAVETLIHDYGRLVFQVIYGLTGDWQESQDLAQDTFLQAFRAIDAARDDAATGCSAPVSSPIGCWGAFFARDRETARSG